MKSHQTMSFAQSKISFERVSSNARYKSDEKSLERTFQSEQNYKYSKSAVISKKLQQVWKKTYHRNLQQLIEPIPHCSVTKKNHSHIFLYKFSWF